MGFGKFLKKIDPELFSEYRMERFGRRVKSSNTNDSAPKMSVPKIIKTASNNNRILDKLVKFMDMPVNLKKYLESRKIKNEYLAKYFFYTDKFKTFSNSVKPGAFSEKSLYYDEPRIVILMFDKNENIIGFQGREINESYAKYVTIKLNEDDRKIFGADRVSTRQPIRVVEGPIDSLFVDNCIAVCGADLEQATSDILNDPVLIFDNEPRSKIICKKIKTAIENGKKVVIFPNEITNKDINDMVLSGINVNAIITENTYSGLRARLAFTKWKRC